MPETWTNISIVGPQAGMFDAWFALYDQYALSRGVRADRRIGGILWRWLLDGTYRVAGVMAVDSRKEIVGFAHYRPFPNTLTGTEGCVLDDLYVSAPYRTSDLIDRLVEHVCNTARKRGWTEVNWVSADDGELRETYDRIATRIASTTYRKTLT